MESGREPGVFDGKVRVISPAALVMESGGKHVQIFASTLKFSNCVLLRVPINNNNHEQPITLSVILAKNTFTNHHGVINIGANSTLDPQKHDGRDLFY